MTEENFYKDGEIKCTTLETPDITVINVNP